MINKKIIAEKSQTSSPDSCDNPLIILSKFNNPINLLKYVEHKNLTISELSPIFSCLREKLNGKNIISRSILQSQYPIIQLLVKQATNHVLDLSSQQIVAIVGAMAAMAVFDWDYFNKAAKEVQLKIETFDVYQLAIIAWAFAKIGIQRKPLFKAIAKEIHNKVNKVHINGATKFSEKELKAFSMLAWAFVVNEHKNIGFVYKMLDYITPHRNLLHMENCRQLFDVISFLETLPNDSQDSIPLDLKKMKDAFVLDLAKTLPIKSKLQDMVFSALNNLGYTVESEYYIPGHFIDCAILYNKTKYAIEVDGPLHFSVDEKHVLGTTKFRNRLLEAYGWTVICLNFNELWHKSDRQLERYISTAIKPYGLRVNG